MTPLHQLVRLLLASDDPQELRAHQAPRLRARLDACWDRLHAAVQHQLQLSVAQAQAWVERLLAALLHEDCCRAAVRAHVPLAEALGLGPGRGSRLRGAARARAVGR